MKSLTVQFLQVVKQKKKRGRGWGEGEIYAGFTLQSEFNEGKNVCVVFDCVSSV